MRNFLVATLACSLLSGCITFGKKDPDTTPPHVTDRDVMFMEVPVCPAPAEIARKPLPIEVISSKSSPAQVSIAYAETVANLKAIIAKQDQQLEQYRKLSVETAKKRADIEAKNKSKTKDAK